MCQVKVGFLVSSFAGWTGGINYLRNLLIAIHSVEDSKIEPVLLVNCEVSEEFLDLMRPYVSLVQFGSLFHQCFPLFVRGKRYRWLKRQLLFKKIRQLGIEVMSHGHLYGGGLPFRTINWIPDFQHVHLPEMFSKDEIKGRDRKFRELIIGSDAVVFSSQDAIDDANRFLPGYQNKFHKLSFVAIPENKTTTKNELLQLEAKYKFSGKYFYLPNQFWKHKNHKVVFKAIRQLKEYDMDVLLLCTGDSSDYRNTEHINELQGFIQQNGLEQNIRWLGLIPYEDVFVLFRYALAIINPSLFEGWSSTVEEAKSIGKKLILSDLAVHKEQKPHGAIFFPKNDYKQLSEILGDCWTSDRNITDDALMISAAKRLPVRISDYGKTYQDIVLRTQ